MNGFDWNGNGYRDVGDSYIDYKIMNESTGGSGERSNRGSGGGSGGDGCGCLTIFMILCFIYLLGSCS